MRPERHEGQQNNRHMYSTTLIHIMPVVIRCKTRLMRSSERKFATASTEFLVFREQSSFPPAPITTGDLVRSSTEPAPSDGKIRKNTSRQAVEKRSRTPREGARPTRIPNQINVSVGLGRVFLPEKTAEVQAGTNYGGGRSTQRKPMLGEPSEIELVRFCVSTIKSAGTCRGLRL